MTVYVHEPRTIKTGRRESNRLWRLLRGVLAHRRQGPSTHRLPEHLLRDIGLQRIGGKIARRMR